MGYFYMQSLQDFEQAQKVFTEATRTRLAWLSEGHPLCAASLNMLAIVYLRQGHAEQAEQIRRRTRPVFQSLSQFVFLDTRPLEESMHQVSRLEIQLRVARESLPQLLKQRENILEHIQRLLDLQKIGILSLDMQRDIAASQGKWAQTLAQRGKPAATQRVKTQDKQLTESEEEERE